MDSSRPSRSLYSEIGNSCELPPSLRPASDAPPPAPKCIQESAVVVIGGGPIGSLAAAMLHFRGVDVTIVERDARFDKFVVSRSYTQVVMKRGRQVAALFPGLIAALKENCIPFKGYGGTVVCPDGEIKSMGIYRRMSRNDPDLRLLRPGIVSAMKKYIIENCPRVKTMYGAECQGLSLEEDGWMRVSLRTDGEEVTLRTRFIIACDGRHSVVLQELRRLAGDPSFAAEISSSKGLEDVAVMSPSSRLVRKTMVWDRHLTDKLGIESTDDAPSCGLMLRLSGKRKGRSGKQLFNSMIFPLQQKYVDDIGGRIGAVIRYPNHAIWKLRTVEEGYNLFQANFPQANVRDIISAENMKSFIEARPTQYGPVRRCKSLVAHIGKSKQGGIVLLGDALHSYPPDVAQGTNSGFEEVGVIGRIFDDADADATLESLLRTFETVHEGDVHALVHIARHAYPWQFEQNMLGLRLWHVNRTIRGTLSKKFPNWFYPGIMAMVTEVSSYREIKRRGDVTTRNLILLGFAILVFVAVIIAICLYFTL